MPMTLKDIEDYDRKDMLRVRDLKQWDNALTLLTSYLAPVIIASEKAAAAAAASAAAVTGGVDAETAAPIESTTKPSSPPSSSSLITTTTDGAAAATQGGRQASSTTTSKFSDFVEDETGQYTKQLTEQDMRLIQWSIAALVRYAPSPSESNVVYMFYLQRQPPIRNDETIDNCLISLIFQYAQVKNDPELQAKGLDLIKVALERGVGLPSYQSRTSVKNQNYGPQKQTILASVSKPILIQQGLQITADGRALEARRPYGQQHQGGRSYGQQKQQQGSHSPHKGSNGFPTGGQRQGQNQAQGQAQGHIVGGRKLGAHAAPGSSSPQPQTQLSQPQQQAPQQTQTQTQAQGKTKQRHRKQDSPRLSNKDTQDNNTSTTSTPTTPRQEEPMDQYDYYTRASRSFSGTERVKSGSRPAFGKDGGGYSNEGKLRTIAFVPASTNPMLKTDHPAPSKSGRGDVGEKDKEDDVNAVLIEHVEKLRLDQTTDE
ncbi:hypothetical protein BG015_008024 [Linnemannia schmuckeri]|uniref:Uncharacterized protein n=1 Tax=Linnemannia schmuckeri TaxID=64567 RepID=A0A9P5RZP1_9FUNG|nr:hypothetical protein BG015_008024 [Linnemannia schmuckeri]